MGSTEHNVRAVHLNKFSAYADEIKVFGFQNFVPRYPFECGDVAIVCMCDACFTRNDGIKHLTRSQKLEPR